MRKVTLWDFFEDAIRSKADKVRELNREYLLDPATNLSASLWGMTPEEVQQSADRIEPYLGIGPGIIAGGRAANAPIRDMARFLKKEQTTDPTTLWRELQVERFPWDKKLRHEIPDDSAKFTQLGIDMLNAEKGAPKTANLLDAISHPELTNAYDDISNVKFSTLPPDTSANGLFDHTNNVLSLRQLGSRQYTPIKSLLHELDHWVQVWEKFSRGFNPGQASGWSRIFPNFDKAKQFSQRVEDLDLQNIRLDPRVLRSMTGEPKVLVTPNIGSQEIYPFAGGELSSNAVMARHGMDEATRKLVPPSDTIESIIKTNLNDPRGLDAVIPYPNWWQVLEEMYR